MTQGPDEVPAGVGGVGLEPLFELVEDDQDFRAGPGGRALADGGGRLGESAARGQIPVRAAEGIEEVRLGVGGGGFDVGRTDVGRQAAAGARP